MSEPRLVESEPRLVDVAFTDGRWLAEVTPGFEGQFDLPTLIQVIDGVQRTFPAETFFFIVDQSSVEGHLDAEAQVLEAREKRGAMIISSMQEF
jgi:hypothetical protein